MIVRHIKKQRFRIQIYFRLPDSLRYNVPNFNYINSHYRKYSSKEWGYNIDGKWAFDDDYDDADISLHKFRWAIVNQ